MKYLIARRAAFAAFLFAAALINAPAPAQTNNDLGAIVTLMAQAAGTVTGTAFNGTGRGVVCVFNQTAHTGTPSSTFSILGYDAASNSFNNLLTSAAITADNTPRVLTVYPGLTVASNVTATNVVPRVFQISVTVGGSTPTVTATISCNTIQ